jgi:hypothetical protein
MESQAAGCGAGQGLHQHPGMCGEAGAGPRQVQHSQCPAASGKENLQVQSGHALSLPSHEFFFLNSCPVLIVCLLDYGLQWEGMRGRECFGGVSNSGGFDSTQAVTEVRGGLRGEVR